jgi:hypothetical protein
VGEKGVPREGEVMGRERGVREGDVRGSEKMARCSMSRKDPMKSKKTPPGENSAGYGAAGRREVCGVGGSLMVVVVAVH